MMEEEYFNAEFKNKFIKLAVKLTSMVKSKDGFLFEPVKIKGKGKGFYYSVSMNDNVVSSFQEEPLYV